MAHAHNSLRDAAKAQGVPCVFHLVGFNPSSVAHHILLQSGRTLEISRTASETKRSGYTPLLTLCPNKAPLPDGAGLGHVP